MLVLKRKEGQWVEIHHRSGDVLRLRVYGICSGVPGRVNIAFDDAPRHFEIRRPERRLPEAAEAEAMPEAASIAETTPVSEVDAIPVIDAVTLMTPAE